MSHCTAALNIQGEHFPCTREDRHDVHGNTDSGAIWVGSEEEPLCYQQFGDSGICVRRLGHEGDCASTPDPL